MNLYDDSDDDVIVCPDCGHRSPMDVGFSIHVCPAGDARRKAESEAFERRYTNGGRKCRVAVLVECFDSEEAIRDAISGAAAYFRPNSLTPQQGEEPMLQSRWKAQKFPI